MTLAATKLEEVREASKIAKRSLRRVQVRDLYGVSLSTVDRTVKAGAIRTRRVGNALLLNADDVEREFGWPEDAPRPPSADAIRMARKLLA